MLILTASDVAAVYGMAEAIDAVSLAAIAHVEGHTAIPARMAMHAPQAGSEVLVMPGVVSARTFGLKVWYAFDVPAPRLPRSSALITLLDPELGDEVVMDGSIITDLRTGAMTGIAATRLALASSRIVAIVGAGIQARTQAIAIVHELNSVEIIRVFSRNLSRRAHFVASLSREISLLYPERSISVESSDSPADACVGADVVVAATTSRVPVINDDWIGDEALVCGVGSHAPSDVEIPPAIVTRASTVVVDTHAGGIDGAGDIANVIDAGLLVRDRVLELGDLLHRERTQRPPGVAVFKSVGFGAADIFSAQIVASAAIAKGLGTRMDIHS